MNRLGNSIDSNEFGLGNHLTNSYWYPQIEKQMQLEVDPRQQASTQAYIDLARREKKAAEITISYGASAVDAAGGF
jgi:hypothetical protein